MAEPEINEQLKMDISGNAGGVPAEGQTSPNFLNN